MEPQELGGISSEAAQSLRRRQQLGNSGDLRNRRSKAETIAVSLHQLEVRSDGALLKNSIIPKANKVLKS